MKRHLDRLKKTATNTTMSVPDSRPIEICQTAKYKPPTMADVNQYGYSIGPMMVEADRTLTQEFYQTSLLSTMFDQHVYYT